LDKCKINGQILFEFSTKKRCSIDNLLKLYTDILVKY